MAAAAPPEHRELRKVSKIWHVAIALTLLLLLAGGARGWIHRAAREGVFPLENGAAWFRRQVVSRAATLFHAQRTLDEKRRLEDELARLRVDALILEGVAAENRELRRQASIPPGAICYPERCLALSYGGALGWWRSLRVNKGSASGIAKGDAVIAPEGLVGYVTDVTDSTADVRLITDPACRISCVLEAAPGAEPARGILQGRGWNSRNSEVADFLYVADPLRIDYLRRESAKGAGAPEADADRAGIPPRTRVTTSGLSGTIPGGIPVGWLVDAAAAPDGLYRTGEVLPAVDFANLTTLFVLTGPGRRR
jgi:rod shape-determining protein MreC